MNCKLPVGNVNFFIFFYVIETLFKIAQEKAVYKNVLLS